MIKAPAILMNGKIYTGGSCHDDIIASHKGLTYGTKGFVTDTGKFVSRTEAAKIAHECGQVSDNIGILFSYDIPFEHHQPTALIKKSKPTSRKKNDNKFKGIDDEEFFS